jgi:hypothetical protein
LVKGGDKRKEEVWFYREEEGERRLETERLVRREIGDLSLSLSFISLFFPI